MDIKSEIKNLEKKEIKKRTDSEIQNLVSSLMNKMTIEEKIGQMSQGAYYSDICTGPQFNQSPTITDIVDGKIGSLLNCFDTKIIYAIQKKAVEESRLHIPLMFMFDVIHGYKTSFPTPLQMACSFDEKLVEEVCRVSAYEASHCGINMTFSPMLDLVRDGRWGRINESCGEDVTVGKKMARAFVKGYQGNDLSCYDSIGACAKHFLGYGAVESGRDYSKVELAEHTIYEKYLPPFEEAIKNDVLSVMLSFNSLNGIPMTMNKKFVRDYLKDTLNFKGFIISDYNATDELLFHKVCKDKYDVAEKCLDAGLDHEMGSTCFNENLALLVKNNPEYEKLIDDSCRRVLTAKYKLGLFDNPYKNIYYDENKYCLTEHAKKVAYDITAKSMVLLKNDDILPLKAKKIGLFVIYADNKSLSGPWSAICNLDENHTIFESLKESDFDVEIVKKYENAKNYDVCLLCIGEDETLCGEGRSRTDINLDKGQIELIENVYKYNKNIIAIVISGRPLILTDVIDKFKALIVGFFPGLMTGDVIRDIISGKITPSGKLSISFPENVGQLPISYDEYPTGRPIFYHKIKNYRYESHYIDCSNYPLFTFGDGLSYNNYIYSDIILSKDILNGDNDSITATFTIENTGKYNSEEIAFMFVEALYGVPIRPTNELRDFKRIKINKNEKVQVSFEINFDTLSHYSTNLEKIVEDGKYLIKIGSNLKNLKVVTIYYKN